MFDHKPVPLPEWIGGFATSNPSFAYDPEPDLSSLNLLGNMDNIKRIKRQLHVFWPEFSWLTEPEKEESRCFQQFAHNVSSIGYDNRGRIWSIICPQQGACLKDICCLNIEVTVTVQRGWVDEPSRDLAADMSVMAKVWFSESSHEKWWVKEARDLFERNNLPFPFCKDNAIHIATSKVGNPCDPIFSIRHGLSERFGAPSFARHDRAFGNAHIEVQVGDIVPTDNPTVDKFNEKIIDLFNISTGNMLLSGNVLTWNLWFISPEGVDTERWENHAVRWRKSIDIDHAHNAPPARYVDGSPFEVKHSLKDLLKEVGDVSAITYTLLHQHH